MNSFRFKSNTPKLSVHVIVAIRQYNGSLSIADIRSRSERGQPLLEFPIFEQQWGDSKQVLLRLLREIESGILPLTIFEYNEFESSSPEEESLTIEQFKARLESL